MREEIKQKIIQELKKGNNILLIGKSGVGKSYLVEELVKEHIEKLGDFYMLYCPFSKPPRQVLYFLLDFLLTKENFIKKGWKSSSLLTLCLYIKDILSNNKKLLLFIDDVHLITSYSAEIYLWLIKNANITICAIGTKPYIESKFSRIDMQKFFRELKILKLEPLTKIEAKELIEKISEKHNITLNDNLKTKILIKSEGSPLIIKKLIQQISNQEEPDFSNNTTVNLFPLFIFAIFVLIGLKYLYRGVGEYDLANFSGFLGIVLFFIMRYIWFWKRKP
ncbi:MAG: AAA family ATPase [Candidatus Nanoarchaeia archaeon]